MCSKNVNKVPSKWLVIFLVTAAPRYLLPAYATPNLLTNPGFETGATDGWTPVGCTLSVTTSQKHSGSYSGIMSDRTSRWDGVQQDIQGLIDDGQSCTISGWVRLENVANDFVLLIVEQTDDSGTNYQFVSWSIAYDDSWAYLSGDFTLNVNGTLSGLSIYIVGPDTGVDFYVDDTELIGPDPDPSYAVGQVDANITYQEIEGFGASGAWYENFLAAHPLRSELYDILFGELGLDIYRLRNTYDLDKGDEYISNSAKIIAAGEASLGRPLKIMISSWSPPDYLKSNNSTIGGTLIKDANGNYQYSEFAQWWADSLDEFSSYGINADYVNMQNEPDYTASWDTCRFTPTETTDLAGYNLAFEALYNELSIRPDCPKLMAPEAIGMYNSVSYIDALIDKSHVYGYAHHLYGDGSHDQPDEYRTAMVNFGARYGYKPLMQTEFAKGESLPITFTDAMNLALLMHNSLVFEGASAYIYWELFWAKPKGLVSLDSPWTSNPGYTINPVYYAFKQYSAFVHSGWKRVDASTDSRNPRISAYLSPDNREMTVVLINTYTAIDVNLDLSFNNFYVEGGDVYQTTGTEKCAFAGGFDPANPLILPAKSITTLALSGAVSTPPVAIAGPNQVVYAGIDGLADVTLDGSGSYDDDGDALEYYWYWTVDGNEHEANGVSLTIQLPVGDEHVIGLIVDDGFVESQPDYCTIRVVEPLEAQLRITPRTLNAKSKGRSIKALVLLPAGIEAGDIANEPLKLYPGAIEGESRTVREKHGRTIIFCTFDRTDFIRALDDADGTVSVEGRVATGRYFYGTDTIRIIHR